MHCVSRGGCYLINSYGDLQEENQWKKESYEACWVSLVLETRPQYRMTLSENDSVRKESYKQQQVVHLMVERSPSQRLRLGRDGAALTEHQLPLLNTTSGCKDQSFINKGVNEAGKQEVSVIRQELYKPVRVNFRASSLMSSPRETSHRVQRRE